MFRVSPIILSLAFPLQVNGQTLSDAEADVLPRILFSDCLDIHDNIGCETILLLKNALDPGSADLIILPDFRDSDHDGALLVAREIAFNGPLWGMAPWIEPAEPEGFTLNMEQIGVGRRPWSSSLTVLWRDGAFVVSEYFFSSYDRILNNIYSCQMNLLTGEVSSEVILFDMETEEEDVIRNEGTEAPLTIPLEEWQSTWRDPEACQTLASIYYSQ